ncbi:MCE family protein [Actinomadura sp. 7K507]|uniref:MCE family protein n=1 Tax=Actinomadura sp. 7K507 TaxID=2530365 RepID=UPI00104D4ED9|nr:MCE family protein [Actinomadura sp. 7K507]TDC98204.1 MCE family protein [Actinomadura sp. 7K507]
MRVPRVRYPRVTVNLVFFALLGVALAVWAARSLIHIDALERPFTVTADFETSPGLHGDLEVTHLGVAVGEVGDIRLSGDHVAVALDIRRDARIPSGVGARVLRKSAIGEPYIELTPSEATGTRILKEGDHIPVSRTAGTTDYKQLFEGLSTTLDAVDPRDTRTLVHELATGLEGRGTDLHDMISDTHRLTGTLAAEAGTLDALSRELTRLTATLTAHRGDIASGVNDLALFSASLRQSTRDLDSVLDNGPGAMKNLHGLLQDARPGLDCLLTAAATPTAPLMTDANRKKINHVLRLVPTLQALVADVTATDASGKYLRVSPVITLTGPAKAATEYTTPVPKPVPPRLTYCDANVEDPEAAEAAAKVRPTPGARNDNPPAGSAPNADMRPVGDGGDRSSSRWLPLLPPVLGGLIVLAAAFNTLSAFVRRRTR